MTAAAPRALIAEDEPLLAAALQAELRTLWPALTIAAVVGDGLQAIERTLTLRPEVCFFDVRMPGCSGIDAALALAEDWPDDGPAFPLLVFVTAYDDHALQAFDAQAVDYLVKPVQPARLAACVARLQRLLAAQSANAATPPAAAASPATTHGVLLEQTLQQLHGLLAGIGAAARPGAASAPPPPRLAVLTVQSGNLVHLVPLDEVLYFEAADKYVRVVTAAREHLIRLSLRDLLPQLDPQRFWQVHRGTVVNALRVASARREDSGKVTLTLKGRAETLVASRLYAHRFKGL